MILGYGILSALDPLAAQAHGAGDTRPPSPAISSAAWCWRRR